jgi:hypothetical protein
VADTWQQLFDDPLLNTFGASFSYGFSNNNPTVDDLRLAEVCKVTYSHCRSLYKS